MRLHTTTFLHNQKYCDPTTPNPPIARILASRKTSVVLVKNYVNGTIVKIQLMQNCPPNEPKTVLVETL